jgi:hypothetical protein
MKVVTRIKNTAAARLSGWVGKTSGHLPAHTASRAGAVFCTEPAMAHTEQSALLFTALLWIAALCIAAVPVVQVLA